MGDLGRVESDLKRDGHDMTSESMAATEAFAFLNAGVRKHYRGSGDTPTAARVRAAREAGISPAQAERVWKRWRDMSTVNGDVYRSLRNTYGHLCTMIEKAADAVEAKRHEIEGTHETSSSAQASSHRDVADRQGDSQARR